MKMKSFIFLFHLLIFFLCFSNVGNVLYMLLKFQQLTNQYNTKELPYYFSLPIIEISVFKAYKAL